MQSIFATALLCLATLTMAQTDDSSYSDAGKLQQAMLDSHNNYRSQHHVDPVTWDPTLAQYAQDHSSNCVFEHSSNGPYGENLAMGYPSASASVDAWYNENSVYDYNGDWQEAAGHFTQVVWKGTSSIGCGATNCPNGWYLTCEYSPAGNVIGQFKDNVLPA